MARPLISSDKINALRSPLAVHVYKDTCSPRMEGKASFMCYIHRKLSPDSNFYLGLGGEYIDPPAGGRTQPDVNCRKREVSCKYISGQIEISSHP